MGDWICNPSSSATSTYNSKVKAPLRPPSLGGAQTASSGHYAGQLALDAVLCGLLALCQTSCSSVPALALQTLDARDGETVLARISQKEITRIAFEKGRIRKVTGNAGEFVLEMPDRLWQAASLRLRGEATA